MIDPWPRFQAVHAEIGTALTRAQSIIDFINQQQPSAEIRVAVLNNVIVSLVSIAEEGLRLVFYEYLAILEEGIGKYKDLRKDLLEANIKGAASLLVRSLDENRKINSADVANDLLNCLTEKNGFKLFKAEITFNRFNLRPREIKDLAKRVGFPKIWEAVRSEASVKAFFPDTDEIQIEQAILQRWTALFDERDTIVHRFSEAQGWGDTIISPYIDFLDVVIGGIARCLSDDATGILTVASKKAGESKQTPQTSTAVMAEALIDPAGGATLLSP